MPIPRHGHLWTKEDDGRILNPQHVSPFSGEDVYRPVRLQGSIHLVGDLDIAHIFAPGKASDLLERHTLQIVFSNERFGHRGHLQSSILRTGVVNRRVLWGNTPVVTRFHRIRSVPEVKSRRGDPAASW
jgi:hypothetical protein